MYLYRCFGQKCKIFLDYGLLSKIFYTSGRDNCRPCNPTELYIQLSRGHSSGATEKPYNTSILSPVLPSINLKKVMWGTREADWLHGLPWRPQSHH